LTRVDSRAGGGITLMIETARVSPASAVTIFRRGSRSASTQVSFVDLSFGGFRQQPRRLEGASAQPMSSAQLPLGATLR
jgi:hypothetical protein